MSKKDTFSSGSPDKGPGMWCKAVKSAIIISLMMLVGEIYAFQSSDLLSQYRHMNSSVIQYIDVEEKRENSYLVSLNVKEMRLADIIETITHQMKVGLYYSSDKDVMQCHCVYCCRRKEIKHFSGLSQCKGHEACRYT